MSSRLQGFDVMDVSTALPNDPKVKRLAREYPDLLAPGFLVYVATLAESWKAGERVRYDDAWPSYLDFDQATVDALRAVRLLDEQGRVTSRGWRGYFEPARKRRAQGRKRYADWRARQSGKNPNLNGKPNGDLTVSQPLANGMQTGNRPSVRPKDSITPPNPPRPRGGRRKATAGLTDYDALMQRDDDEPEAIDWLDEPAEAKR